MRIIASKYVRWIALAAVPLSLVGLIVLSIVEMQEGTSTWDEDPIGSLLLFLAFLAFPIVGALIVWRQPRNVVGWVFCGIGLLTGLGSAAQAYSEKLITGTGRPQVTDYMAAWMANWWWYPLLALVTIFTLLFFPTGRLASRRWRPVLWLSFLGTGGITFIGMVQPRLVGTKDGTIAYDLDNPIGRPWFGDPENGPIGSALFGLFALLVLLSVLSLILRFRRSRGVERQQLKWFTFAAATLPFSLFLEELLNIEFFVKSQIPFAFGIGMLPAAVGIAVLRYRLYDIDVVINKTIVFGVLAAFITGIYVAIVVGIGTLFGSQDEPNLALSIAATAIVAIAFSPVKERTQRFANRLVYGQRATPYEALHSFTEGVATTYETDKVAPAMAKTILDATGAERAEVWLALDHTLVRAASQPEQEANTPEAVSLGEDMTVTSIAGADITAPVIHSEELLGALTLTKKRGETPTPVDEKLLADLASQAGIVLRNSRLTAELRARLDQITRTAEEIRQSRQRIVAAQDKARRALERDIHDGAQQHLVALAVKLNLAKTMAQKKPERAEAMLVKLKDEAQDALDTLDELAQGIYPPVLAEHGIAKAIETRADKTPFALNIHDETRERFDPHVEAATYFCILEALQNVAKYANATQATVTLREEDGDLSFTITDDGAGFDPATTDYGTGIQGMGDRLAAVGGTVELASAPGGGTTVTGRVPTPKGIAVEAGQWGG